ncbi:hypothetical protein AB0H71_27180 [Nocardia sp. NPDC050697]|uniref:hypothetical protein n=1 Tax=Nocardia sp. NPDC050697 TaxID=3155158 RepID=UPI0033FC25FF
MLVRRLALGLAAIGGGVLAVLLALDRLTPVQAVAVAVAGIVALCSAVAAIAPKQFPAHLLRRVKSFGFGGASFELFEVARESVAEGDDSGERSKTLLALKMRLESKLTYVAKHMLALDPSAKHNIPAFVTIGSLAYDKLLTEEQAHLAYAIIGLQEPQFRELSPAERTVILEGADDFIGSVRASILEKLSITVLEAKGWLVKRVYSESSKWRDLRVRSRNPDVEHRVVPVFTLKRESKFLEQAAARLVNDRAGDGERLIIVPPLSKAVGTAVTVGARQVPVLSLPAAVERLNSARGG